MMAWSFEFKAGLGWALLIAALMVVALWLMRVVGNAAPVLLPIVVFFGFMGWVRRIQK